MMYVIGLMSGTSADGIDAALVELDGAPPSLQWRVVQHVHIDFENGVRREILDCVTNTRGTVDRICALNVTLGEAYAEAVKQCALAAQFSLNKIDLIGSHGQTVWHIPAQATIQIGEGAVIAERTGVTTITNFRSRDIAAGGQGAPLVAYTDQLMFTDAHKTRALQNIGGIGNVTFLSATRDLTAQNVIAFDTGPGNMLIDDVARRASNGAYNFDVDGRLAASGTVNGALFEELMDHAFFDLRPPKSTGRELFGAQMGEELWARAQSLGIAPRDLAATVTQLTAESIVRAYQDYLPQLPDQVIISGGGALNPTLMQMLRMALHARKANVEIFTSDDFGLSSEAKEAVAFAVLAYESIHLRSGNAPFATGARHPIILGNITPADNYRTLMQRVLAAQKS